MSHVGQLKGSPCWPREEGKISGTNWKGNICKSEPDADERGHRPDCEYVYCNQKGRAHQLERGKIDFTLVKELLDVHAAHGHKMREQIEHTSNAICETKRGAPQ